MKTFKNPLLILTLIIFSLYSNGQVITIPTVVHVVWHDSTENISDAQIQSQIDVLNRDFRKLNADTVNVPAPFRPFAGDAQIEFCLAQRDPNGNATTGITRTYTPIIGTINIDTISHTALGGEDSWNSMKYFNIWVENMSSYSYTTSGVATSPYNFSEYPEEDGVYMLQSFFGTIGTAYGPEEGRETDLEVSRWLNLYTTGEFGGPCGDDSVSDTPPIESPTTGCVTFPHNPNSSCGTNGSGEMTSNFMTYSDGTCKNFFTNGQIARMHACLNSTRSSLLTSDGCLPVGINELTEKINLKLFPNPSSGIFSLVVPNLKKAKLEIYNVLGSIVYHDALTSPQSTIDISSQASGIYLVLVTNGSETRLQKVIKE